LFCFFWIQLYNFYFSWSFLIAWATFALYIVSSLEVHNCFVPLNNPWELFFFSSLKQSLGTFLYNFFIISSWPFSFNPLFPFSVWGLSFFACACVRFSCGLLGHLCTFPRGLEISFKVWPYLFNSSLQFEVLLCAFRLGNLRIIRSSHWPKLTRLFFYRALV